MAQAGGLVRQSDYAEGMAISAVCWARKRLVMLGELGLLCWAGAEPNCLALCGAAARPGFAANDDGAVFMVSAPVTDGLKRRAQAIWADPGHYAAGTK